jgi:hypothetical protein
MKLVICDGRELTVRDVGPVVFRLTASTIPLKPCGRQLMDEDVAHQMVREMLDSGLYEGGRVV